MNAMTVLKWFLRLIAASMLCAWVVLPMPVAWMDYVHDKWMGMGRLPDAPVMVYMARMLCAMYGFVGLMFALMSRDIMRYASLLRWSAVAVAVMTLAVSALLIGSGMPPWYVAGDAISATGMAAVILFLLHRATAGRGDAT